MNNTYTQNQIIDLILEVAYPDPEERQRIDKSLIQKHYDDFLVIIDY